MELIARIVEGVGKTEGWLAALLAVVTLAPAYALWRRGEQEAGRLYEVHQELLKSGQAATAAYEGVAHQLRELRADLAEMRTELREGRGRR